MFSAAQPIHEPISLDTHSDAATMSFAFFHPDKGPAADVGAELFRLADVVEKAAAADRNLDAVIFALFKGGRPSHDFTADTPADRLRRSYGPGTVFNHLDPMTNGGHLLMNMGAHAPRYTDLLEEAISLIPATHTGIPKWKMETLGETFHVNVHVMGVCHHAMSPRLVSAITAAALRGWSTIRRTAIQ